MKINFQEKEKEIEKLKSKIEELNNENYKLNQDKSIGENKKNELEVQIDLLQKWKNKKDIKLELKNKIYSIESKQILIERKNNIPIEYKIEYKNNIEILSNENNNKIKTINQFNLNNNQVISNDEFTLLQSNNLNIPITKNNNEEREKKIEKRINYELKFNELLSTYENLKHEKEIQKQEYENTINTLKNTENKNIENTNNKQNEEIIKKLEEQISQLKQQNEGFKKQIITLNGMVKSFRSLGGLSIDENDESNKDKQVNKLTKEIEKLNLTISEDKEQFALLLNQINDEKSNSFRLKEENDKLLEEINNLKNKNERKSAPNEESIMKDAFNALTEENLILKEELDKIKNERERLKTEGDDNKKFYYNNTNNSNLTPIKEKNNLNNSNENSNINSKNNTPNKIKFNNSNNIINLNNNDDDNIKIIKNKLEEKDRIIEKLSKKNKEWEEDLYNHTKEIKYLQNYISELEEGIGSSEQMDDLRNALEDKDELVKNLSNQITEYQSKCDLILNNISNEDKDKKIEILIKEIKVIRQKIIDMISFNGRIENYHEFVNVINRIKNNVFEYIDSNEELQDSFEKLNNLMICCQINDDIANMKLIREISKD